MSVGAEFFGGPLDGRLQAFPGAEPPPVVVIRSIAPRPPRVPLDDPTRELRTVYVRDAEPRSEGMWWLRYVPNGGPVAPS